MVRVRDVRVRRVYEQASPGDGQRFLVDRLWPRGLARSAAHLDEWVKAVAPSDDLRRWYGHDPARFAEFRRRYVKELGEPDRARALTHLNEAAREGTITLLTATKDAARSEAEVLAELVRAGATTDGVQGLADLPGDPACRLKRVCPSCGSIAGEDPPTTCPGCRAEIPAQ